MKPLNKFTREYFDKYNEKQVKLLPYNVDMTLLADKYISMLAELLKNNNVKFGQIGSVAYKIPALDVEIAVYTDNSNKDMVIETLKSKFGEPTQNEKEFTRFEIFGEKYEFDIHVYSGYEGEISEKLTRYMLDHPELTARYKKVKEQYAFSKREYKFRKHEFLNDVIKIIPENY